MSNTSVTTSMIPWLHFTGGDHLYFESWHPSSKGAIAGACIGLVFLALLERWMSAMRSVMEAKWKKRALSMTSNKTCNESSTRASSSSEKQKGPEVETEIHELNTIVYETDTTPGMPRRSRTYTRMIAPFIAAHDIPRGVIHAVQALLGYVLMLAVMTFQAAYFISIVLGLGLGEILFGRMGGVGAH